MERECERRRGGQSQTRRQQTKAVREKEGEDVQQRRRREGQGKVRGGYRVKRMEVVTVCNERDEKVGKGFCVRQSFTMQNK